MRPPTEIDVLDAHGGFSAIIPGRGVSGSASRSVLSVKPILELSPMELAQQMAARLGGEAKRHERTIHRARASGGLTPQTADRIASGAVVGRGLGAGVGA